MSAAPALKLALKYKIKIIKGAHAGTQFDFNKPVVSIGRGSENDIVLSNDGRASRQHAEIKQNGNELYIVNISQKNFVLLNGEKVQSEKLESDCIITIGESDLKFEMDNVKSMTVVQNSLAKAHIPNVAPMQGSLPVQQQGAAAPAQRQQHYASQQPPPQYQHAQGGQAAYSSPGAMPVNKQKKPVNITFYAIIAIVLVGGFWLFGSNKIGKKVDPNAIRSSLDIDNDLAASDKMIEELQKRKKSLNEVQNIRAQENFVKGFRDFQKGQYSRAKEFFQVVLNLDPDNDLAKRYLQLSKIKFDEMIKFSMIQGARYRDKRNWRMCQSSFFNVMTMLQSRKDDKTYIEAKRYYDECGLNLEGRF